MSDASYSIAWQGKKDLSFGILFKNRQKRLPKDRGFFPFQSKKKLTDCKTFFKKVPHPQ